ncbi:hypothetical protein ACHAWO_011771 [Cyclotella atomus]|uniref:Aminotransferase class I/classII large domain-containing protein n=1 Tax=Cyclotella atomus TaxID=382360 RepID=A0ABD3NPB6_9STRA
MPPSPHAATLSPSSSTAIISPKSWASTALRALISLLSPILPVSAHVHVASIIEASSSASDTATVVPLVSHKFDMGLPIILRDASSSSRSCVTNRQVVLGFASNLRNNRSSFRSFSTDNGRPKVVVAKPSLDAGCKTRSFSKSMSVSKNDNDNQSNTKNSKSFSTKSSSKLSSNRAQKATSFLPSYLLDARSITKYHPVTSPEGALQLSVAENQLSEVPLRNVKLLGYTSEKENLTLMDVLSALASSSKVKPSQDSKELPLSLSSSNDGHVFDREMIYYQPTQGTMGLRKIMSHYLHKLLLSPSSPLQFKTDNLILGAGCNAVLENLCMTLCDAGDAVMIPTPYYAAFEFDLGSRAGCEVVPVNTMDYHANHKSDGCGEDPSVECYYPNKSSLNAAYERSIRDTGRPPRVLLISHPNNPLGVCYPPYVMQECIDWCREREVHLISDEIYAGSVYKNTTTLDKEATFVSAMSLASNHEVSDSGLGLGPYIHLVYALSKDFALSGLRVGVAYTENDEILFALQKLNDFCQISSHTQLLVERMLTAQVERNGVVESFVDMYLEANNRNIRSRSDKLVQCLDELDIPYLEPDSGLFLWMDLREFLPELSANEPISNESLESKEKRERELYLSLMKEYGLLFTPGMSMRNEHAGFFRCVFTAASEEEFELGLVRIKKFVEARRF